MKVVGNLPRCKPRDILKIRVLIAADDRARWPEIKTKIREWGEKEGYLIHVVQPILLETIRGRNAEKSNGRQQQTDEELLRTYAKHRDLDNLTLKAGINLARKV
jgi:hypothetical protein